MWDILRTLLALTVSGTILSLLLMLVRPTIVLPRGTEPDRLGDILAHELVHARRQDLLYKWFAAAVTSLHWFNPMMVVVHRQLNRACELSCDGAVVKGMDAAGRRHYGETLLAMAAGRPPREMGLLAVPLWEEKRHLRERLVFVMRPGRTGPAAALTLALVLALAGCAAVFGAEPTPSAGPGPAVTATPNPDGLLEEPTLYTLPNGLTAALPADLEGDLLVLPREEGEVFLSVYDRRSYEAGGGAEMEMGWLFSLARYDQLDFEQTLIQDNSGRSFFARGAGWYYACLTPTDVRFYTEAEDQSEALAVWEELNRRLPEETLPDFIVRNGLEPFTSGDYLAADGTLWGGQHCYVNYHTPDWSESLTLLLSQTARQGEGGIWCVEGCFHNNSGDGNLVLPRETGMTAADWYAALQLRADEGREPGLLTPEGAGLDWLADRYGGVTLSQLTRLEGEPAWDLWFRELSDLLRASLEVRAQVYVSGQPTQVETVTGEPPYAPALWTRVWVKAEDPGLLSGPAVVFDGGEAGTVLFLEQDGLVGVERNGETAWYQGAYPYESSPYACMEALFREWKEGRQ